MASLQEALGTSALRSAYCDVDAATRLVVSEEADPQQPGKRSGYVVTVQRGAGLPQKLELVSSVEETLGQISGLGLSGFDAAQANWQAASSNSGAASATWADDANASNTPDSSM